MSSETTSVAGPSRGGRKVAHTEPHPVAGVYIALIRATPRDGLTYDEWVHKITQRFRRAFRDG